MTLLRGSVSFKASGRCATYVRRLFSIIIGRAENAVLSCASIATRYVAPFYFTIFIPFVSFKFEILKIITYLRSTTSVPPKVPQRLSV